MSVLTDADPTDEEPTAAQPLRAVAASVALTVAGLVASLVGGVALVVPVLVLGLEVQSLPVFLGLAVVGQLGFLVVGYGYARYAGVRVRVAVPSASEAGYALGGTLLSLLLVSVLAAVVSVLGLLPDSVIGGVAETDPTLLLWLALLSVVLVAPAEEFLFRGVIQTRLRRAFGPVAAIVGASILFGSLHLGNYVGTLGPVVAGVLLVSVVGAVMGGLYERTGNLTVPVVAHATYNVVLLVGAYLVP
ncbi:CPBP family intramembrane glutamic endopeptidase [Haloglomus litoreum]|uniref:CPBP family intramembrane glutamic endopeptidase n=1 Tax=Haloglomus litoreum TaxID=3034026 RepID=UPI0023E8F040|nr:CPBP family intramembrane glutamic endopeptidase [Haloglomus sp. DT116]